MANAVEKIMYLMDYYLDPRGGTEGQFLQLIQFLDRSRFEPAITFLYGTDYIEHSGFGCQVRVIGIRKLASIRSIVKVLHYALSLRLQNYRLVHCYFNDSSLLAPLFRAFGIRVVVARRDMGFWHTPLNLAILRLVAVSVDRYVANSQAVRRVVYQRERVPYNKISVIHNGYVPRAINGSEAEDAMELPGVSGPAPVVGVVANLRPIKRIDTLIEAFALIAIRYPLSRLVIVGGEDLVLNGASVLEALEGLSSRLGVRDRVVFAGRVKDPVPYIKRFTVAVLCSASEGFSNSIIEYMQAGRPIVCTNTGGNAELVQDGYNGYLVPVGDAQALADRLLWLLSDSALASRLGKNARETVLSLYTHTRMVTEHMSCYDELLAASRPALSCKRASGRTR